MSPFSITIGGKTLRLRSASPRGAVEIENSTSGNTQTKRFVGIPGAGLIDRLEDETFYWILPDH